MTQRCQACGHVVEESRTATQRVGSADVEIETCPICLSVRLVDDRARAGAVVTYGGAP